MKRSNLLWVLFLSVLFIVPCVASNSKQKDKVNKSHLVFVVRAASATISKGDGGLRLTLHYIYSKVIYFNQYDKQLAGLMSTKQFMSLWKQKGSDFTKVPSNTAIVFDNMPIDQQGNIQALAVEIKNPSQTGPHTWVLQMVDLEGKILLGDYKNISIFIEVAFNPFL